MEQSMSKDVGQMNPDEYREFMREMRVGGEKLRAEMKPTDPIDLMCHEASAKATLWAQNDGLHPTWTDDGEYRYTAQQGHRSAHHAREDSAAILILIRPVLHRLHNIQRLLWVVILVLCAITWKVWHL